MKPYVGEILVVPVPDPVLEQDLVATGPSQADFYARGLGGRVEGENWVMRSNHGGGVIFRLDDGEDALGTPIAEPGGPVKLKGAISAEHPSLQKGVVVAVGPGVPEIEAGYTVFWPAANGFMGSVGHKMADGSVMLPAGYIAGYEESP